MRRFALALAVLAAALLIGFAASQPPRARSASAPAAEFSAERAMADVREIARAPRPTGSAENARVRSYLLGRMRQLGMATATQSAPLPKRSAERLRKWGGPAAVPNEMVNLIGLLPGRDRSRPAILLMAHHDSVWGSPGAPDDAAGVSAALEIVRALRARGTPERDVALLFTDAEEIGLVGAKAFFDRHPLARRIGAVVNMESRGGGGRTAMFETGRGNGAMMEVYSRSVPRPSSNSLAVLIYELMPNNTDFTIPKGLGIPGFNFAFIGDARLYHSPAATAEALDADTLQDLGQQALAVTRALAFAPALPAKAEDAVFGDVLGLFVIAYRPIAGWAVLALAGALFGFAWWKVRTAGREIAAGAATAIAFLLHTMLILIVLNLVSGTLGANYYDRLAALPRLELQALLACMAALLLACVAARPERRLGAALPALILTAIALAFTGWSPFLLGIGLAAAAAALLLPGAPSGVWGGWFGLAAPVFLLALGVQVAAPTAGPVLAWPLLLCAAAMASAAATDPGLRRPLALGPVSILAVLGGAQIFYLAHFTFLGIGAKNPEAMGLHALLIGMLVWPLFRRAAHGRIFAGAAAVLVLASAGLALSVRLDAMAETVPPYSDKASVKGAGR